ncbi:hypothetical protein [Leuconostoc mesenteroides]|uniref:hypothetical protein n=1 Tax=Leuconostoc mesenteroides TaxID=1245 RepID=UPI000AC43C6A|nr:hypothetical protein [Leuconostoc mesenteroides]
MTARLATRDLQMGLDKLQKPLIIHSDMEAQSASLNKIKWLLSGQTMTLGCIKF